jgi:hypothetical protein
VYLPSPLLKVQADLPAADAPEHTNAGPGPAIQAYSQPEGVVVAGHVTDELHARLILLSRRQLH